MFKKALSALALISPAVVFAAVPEAVTTAMSDMKADALTIATAFLVAVIAVTAFTFMRKGAKG